MPTTKDGGTPEPSAGRRPPGRWREAWPAVAALAGALLVATMLAAELDLGDSRAWRTTTSGLDCNADDRPPVLEVLFMTRFTRFGGNSPQFHSADAACRHLLPSGITDDGSGP